MFSRESNSKIIMSASVCLLNSAYQKFLANNNESYCLSFDVTFCVGDIQPIYLTVGTDGVAVRIKSRSKAIVCKFIDDKHYIGMLIGKRIPLYVRRLKAAYTFNKVLLQLVDVLSLYLTGAASDIDIDMTKSLVAIYHSAIKVMTTLKIPADMQINILPLSEKVNLDQDKNINIYYSSIFELYKCYTLRTDIELAIDNTLIVDCAEEYHEIVVSVLRDVNLRLFE